MEKKQLTKLIKNKLKAMGIKSSVRGDQGGYMSVIWVNILTHIENKVEIISELNQYESYECIDNVIVNFN